LSYEKRYASIILYIVATAVVVIVAYRVGYQVASFPPASLLAQTPAGTISPAGSIIIPVSIVSLREDASSSPSVSVEYPQFPSLGADLNSAIASSTLGRLAYFRRTADENQIARQATGGASASLPPDAYSFTATWEPALIDPDQVSFIERYDSYTGGANEQQEVQTFNYDIPGHRLLSLADLFPGVPDYLDQISALAREQLTETMVQSSQGNAPTDMIDAGTQPTVQDFSDFTFTDNEVTFYFPKYAVAPGSFGEQRAVIGRDAIK
jgi:hypothetical protein